MDKSTEKSSIYNDLESMDTLTLLTNINKEDQKVAQAVEKELKKIEALVDSVYQNMILGGRLFYIGAGTSGRLGIVDASECPPTFGIEHGIVIGLIAGGDGAIKKAVEFAEDDINQGWIDLKKHDITQIDSVIGIAASGTTPYVLGALKMCKQNNILTASISCNKETPISAISDHSIEAIVGPEFVTGSTRMKSGTAQKLILNMISTSLMIKLGRVKGNKMVDMQLSNHKLVERGIKMIVDETNLKHQDAKTLLLETGSVRNAINKYKNG